MKKITTVLFALVLICTSAFASFFSFTVGGGFGTKIPVYENHEIIIGPTCFAGVDFKLKNGISFYDDVEFGLVYINGNKYETVNGSFYNFTEKLGVGYTIAFKNWDLMFGTGMKYQSTFDEDKEVSEYRLGVDLRIKATVNCTDRIGISVQIDPAVDFKALGDDVIIDGNEISGNALVGFTFKF